MNCHAAFPPQFQFRPINIRASSQEHKSKLARAIRVQPGQAVIGSTPGKPLWDCDDQQHFTIKKGNEAYYRVLFRHETKDDRSQSAVGQFGHIERSSAWSHLMAAAICIVYAFIRPAVLDMHSLTAQFSGASIVMSAVTFGVSTVYHVYGTVPGCASIVRNLDILAIYMSLATATVADLCLVTNDFENVPFQAMADPFLAATILGVYFTVRRIFVPRDETREDLFEGACSLGLYRFQHSDLEHAGLRVAGVSALTHTWVQMAPAAFFNLSPGVATVWIMAVLLATILLVSGVLFDNFYLPDTAVANGKTKCLGGLCTACSSKKLGCVMTSHAWWHVISFAGVFVLTVAREYGVTQIK